MAIATLDTTARQYTEADYTDFEHTGPDTLAGRCLRRFWHPVYISEQLQSGWAVPIRLLNEDLTLYPGEGGAAHVVDFRCAPIQRGPYAGDGVCRPSAYQGPSHRGQSLERTQPLRL